MKLIINFSGFRPWFLIFITIPALKDGPIKNGILKFKQPLILSAFFKKKFYFYLKFPPFDHSVNILYIRFIALLLIIVIAFWFNFNGCIEAFKTLFDSHQAILLLNSFR